jgi:dipeptidyl aminopeptidase/acylaminoacyl peptidase
VDDVRQPILFVHGEIDRQIPVTHLTQLSELARQGRSRSVEVVTVRGVNHLLVPAITGEVGEYASLTDRSVSADVRSTVTGWLTKTFAAIK